MTLSHLFYYITLIITFKPQIVNTANALIKFSCLHKRRDCYTTKPFQNRTIPSPCTTFLAPLSKGSWIDGTTQTVALLLSACDMSTLFILQTFLPSRRRDCYTVKPFRNRTIPSPCTTFLAPLSKGSWIATRLLLS